MNRLPSSKKAMGFLLMAFLLVGSVMTTQAEETRARKLGRGLSNIFFGVLEIPKNMMDINRQYGGAAGVSWGAFRGIYRFYVRAKTGAGEVRHFMEPTGAVIEPEFWFLPEEDVKWRVKSEGEWY